MAVYISHSIIMYYVGSLIAHQHPWRETNNKCGVASLKQHQYQTDEPFTPNIRKAQ